MIPRSSQPPADAAPTTEATAEAHPVCQRARSLRLRGELAEALRILRRQVEQEPDEYRLHDELGLALGELGRQEEAIGCFLTALRLKPDFHEACRKIGHAFASRGLLEPARMWFQRAYRNDPDSIGYLHSYGTTLVALGHLQEAAEIFGKWVKAEPDNPIARHLANAALGSQTSKAPADYVRAMFNACAPRFDNCLARLNNCGPQLVRNALVRVAAPPAHGWDVLDAGCGTGLVGPLLRPLARRLVGVDLSAAMLEVARGRAVYDELVEAEIIEYLRGQSPQYHVLIASDVLTYLGDLAEFFQAAARALLPGGMVVLTVELLQDAGTYQLNPTGRFSHSERYLRSALEDAGFVVKLLDNDVMRHEASRPVPSLVAVGEVTAG